MSAMRERSILEECVHCGSVVPPIVEDLQGVFGQYLRRYSCPVCEETRALIKNTVPSKPLLGSMEVPALIPVKRVNRE